MFASHFARAKASKRKKETTTTSNAKEESSGKGEQHRKNDRKTKDDNASTHSKKQSKRESQDSNTTKPRKRRRHEQRAPRRVRPSAEALELSRQLQELSRQKKLSELIDLFWKQENAKIRDNHHVCIVVDCCSKCGGDIDTAEQAVDSLFSDYVSVETRTALLKCYVHAGDLYKAMKLFRQMCQSKQKHQYPNVRTLNTLLRGCLWTASTEVVVNGKTQVAGGVVSSEEAWKLYHDLHNKDEANLVDTSSYEASIILLCQALRVEEAQKRIELLQSQYNVKVKGKASIKGGDQSSLETCGISYLSLARAYALLGKMEDMWVACQRCLHAIQASQAKLEQGDSQNSTGQGGKRGWKVDESEEGQKRAASNLAYRRHRLKEVENEALALLKRRNSKEFLTSEDLCERLTTKLLYFAGGTVTKSQSMQEDCSKSSAVWHSFGLEQLAGSNNSKLGKTSKRLPCAKDGAVDLAKVFSRDRADNPTDVEIGSGFGDWIVRQALAFPDRNHFAVELRADRVYQIFCRGTLTATKALDNLCTIGSDSGSFLGSHLKNQSISSVFVNHPEPPTQVLGQNLCDLEGIMADETEPVHMLNSTTLGWAMDALVQGGRIVIVTDNRNYGNLICATFVRLLRKRRGCLRCLDATQAKKMKLKSTESFPENITMYEGKPSLQIGHARDDMLTGQSYFDRLWTTGAGSHADTIRRYIIVMYKDRA